MTNPQKENGYTPICNELLEAIYESPFNATQLKILMVVCRYTYGFSRKEHSISENFIAKAVNVSKRYISSELNKLIEQKVITIVKAHTDTTSRVLRLNKHYDEWTNRTEVQQVNNTSTGDELISTTVEQSITTTDEQLFHQDKQNLKQNLKQDIEQIDKLWGLYPNKKGKANAIKKIPKLIKEFTYEQLERCVERYTKETKGTETQFIKHGDTFFNSGYVDYLDKNFTKEIIENNSWGGLKKF